MTLSRRDLLALGGMTLAGTTLSVSAARAQAPKRGGTLVLRGWDPPLFDPMLQTAYRVQIPITFTHSRLVKHKAGPSVAPATFAIEGDLAESWSQPNETTYVFKLRRGVRWHPKPPVNGRELTAEDVRYTVERFLTVKGNPMAYMLSSVDRVEAVDRYTVKFVLKEPFSWLLDVLANPMAVAIVARECVEKFGDLKKVEAVVGTGPWMLDSYRPNVGLTFVRNPNYFVAGLPYIDRIEYLVDEDNASRMAAFLSGKYDLGWEFPGSINRTDWVQIKDALKQKRPNLRTAEFPSNVETHISMRTDQPPFKDVRVRQAVSLAIDRQGMIDTSFEGAGNLNAAVPAGLVDWALPIAQMGEGAKYFRYDSRGGQAPPRGRRISQRLCRKPVLHDVWLDAPFRQRAAHSERSQGRGHQHEARSARVRRLHRQLLLRQVRLDDRSGRRRRSSTPTTSCSACTIRAKRRTRATSTTRSSPTC
jgi:peptide/nickel transport system substrate-binding protein